MLRWHLYIKTASGRLSKLLHDTINRNTFEIGLASSLNIFCSWKPEPYPNGLHCINCRSHCLFQSCQVFITKALNYQCDLLILHNNSNWHWRVLSKILVESGNFGLHSGSLGYNEFCQMVRAKVSKLCSAIDLALKQKLLGCTYRGCPHVVKSLEVIITV